jgi:hypothetical protein
MNEEGSLMKQTLSPIIAGCVAMLGVVAAQPAAAVTAKPAIQQGKTDTSLVQHVNRSLRKCYRRGLCGAPYAYYGAPYAYSGPYAYDGGVYAYSTGPYAYYGDPYAYGYGRPGVSVDLDF